MRIVQVSVGSVRMPPKEGSAPLQVIFNTSKHLARLGHQVVILDRRYTKDDPAVEQLEGVEIVRLKVMHFPFAKAPGFVRFVLAELNAALFALGVSSYLRKNSSKIDVIHLHLTSIGLIVSILNRKLRKKIVYTCHLGEWELSGRKLSLFERVHLLLDPYLMRRVNRVIALNNSAKESFVSKSKINADKIVVVHNGVDTDFFRPYTETGESTRKKYGLEGKLTVLFVGRMARIKGVEHLVKSANILANDFGYGNVVFVLVGPFSFDATEKPINREEMLGFIKQHQLDRNIVLTGSLPLEEVRALYAASDIFVLPSLAEGDPLVTLEAMASGKPVIGTRIGGIPHHIRDGWNGFLIDPANEQQLADKIEYLIDNPEERKSMGANSRKYAEEEFDWKKVAERLLKVYQDKSFASQSN
jgi:glycosyltransferase involved in cell wall biosynthesis